MPNTFSQLIDSILVECNTPQLEVVAPSYVNQTLRELHADPSPAHKGAVMYRDNLKEVQVTATGDTGFLWQIPNPQVFQTVQAVRYDSRRDALGNSIFAKEIMPGSSMNSQDARWYRGGQTISFNCYGGVNALISIAWFEFTASLKYFPVGQRPAEYDLVNGWTYKTEYNTSDAQRLLAQSLVTNWLLQRWDMVVEEGLRQKIYKRMTDARAQTSYSLYQSGRQELVSSESISVGIW